VLKIAVLIYDLTIYDVGMLLYRPGFEETPSVIEEICIKAHQLSEFYLLSKL
jgi:hypothetical protein